VKCGSCHQVNNQGIPTWFRGGGPGAGDFDAAVTWAHEYTDEQSVLTTTCLNCHNDRSDEVAIDNGSYLDHAMSGSNQDLPRGMMDKAETELFGAPFSSTDGSDGVCLGCHGNEVEEQPNDVSSCDNVWKLHLTEGRVAQSTWEIVTDAQVNPGTPGDTCGW
jgi:hypothetical protein